MRFLATLSVVLTLLGVLPAQVGHTQAELPSGEWILDADVEQMLASAAVDQPLSVIVVLHTQANLHNIDSGSRAEQQRRVIQLLQTTADTTQVNLRALLSRRRTDGVVSRYTPFWVENAISVTGTRGVINELAAQPEVARIAADLTIPAPQLAAPEVAVSAVAEANLTQINAPALWGLGYRGQGTVVANMDTGVDVTHPELAGRWRGGANSWYDPYAEHPTVPTDLNGHGTWTMSVMVGGDAGGTAIGVAPEARWIAVKIFNDAGNATSTAIHSGFQWLMDPDNNPVTADGPNIVNNSWTMGAPSCNLDFEVDLQSLVAAGITPVFAAGNYGPAGGSVASPANNPDALSVGAVDDQDAVTSFSSRGPTSCGGSSRTAPDLVAPGVNIRVADLFGFYFVTSGTSLAAPHVSAGLALLLNVRPTLSVEQQRALLSSTTVDLGAPGADNDSGTGRLDLLAAYSALTQSPPPSLPPSSSHVLDPAPNAAGWNNTDVLVQLSAVPAEGGASVSSMTYSATGAQPIASTTVAGASTSFQITAAGVTDVSYFATDADGNVEAPKTATVRIDRTTPVTTSVLAPSPNAAGWNIGSVTVSLTAADDASGSGVMQLTYSASGAQVVSATVVPGASASVTITNAGTTTVSFFATDTADNVEPARQITIKIDPNAPVAQAPTWRLPSTFALGRRTAPVVVNWSATDSLSGVARYEVRRSTDGGGYVTVAQTSATSATFDLGVNHSYRFQVRATDNAGNTSKFATGASFSLTLIQETVTCTGRRTSDCWIYAGRWSSGSVAGASGGTVQLASATKASAIAVFFGTSVGLVTTKGPDRGILEVWVDGSKKLTVDLYSANLSPGYVVALNGLTQGRHRLQVRVLGTKNAAATGTRVDIDALVKLQ